MPRLPPTTTDSYKVGIDVEIIANLSGEQPPVKFESAGDWKASTGNFFLR